MKGFAQNKVKFAAGIYKLLIVITPYMVFSVTYTIFEGPKLEA
jgi:hypothetical protein